MSSALICQPPGSKKAQTLLAALLILIMKFILQIQKDFKVFFRSADIFWVLLEAK
jgi:hypothetical protein